MREMPAPKAFLRRFILHSASRCDQRGRGRSGGRAVSGRGRMRKRGPSGGGTLRSESPQQGQRPSSQNARVASARSQWPRASHCGLMHCTVKPGKYCMSFFLSGRSAYCGEACRRDPSSPELDNGWRELWRKPFVVSRGNTTIYWGMLAPALCVVDDSRDGDDAVLGRKSAGRFHRMRNA